MPGSEFVTHFRNAQVPGSYLDKPRAVFAFGNDDGINNAPLIASHRDRCVPPFFDGDEIARWLFEKSGRGCLPDQDIFFIYNGFRIDNPIIIEVFVAFRTMSSGYFFIRNLDPVYLPPRIPPLLSLIRPEEVGSPQTAIDRGFVEDQGIFDIVSFKTKDRNNEVLSSRTIIRSDQIRGLGVDNGPLDIMKQMTPGIWPEFHV